MENFQMIPSLLSSEMGHTRLFAHFSGTDDDHHEMKEEEPKFDLHMGNSNNNFGNESGTSFGSERNSKKRPSTKEGKNKVKRHKFAFQTRSQVDVLDDGYRWRKYGQKTVKNSKFPRSYYKCTYQGCNVKKQIQRLCMDEGVVVTTYEGMHTHSIEKANENFDHILKRMQNSYTTAL
ncbi:WRKY domain containing protein [Parasponia andersonii]|uniref:WRKY domain containing protein n=1 Tax=Parasponia andersonii TaxID=3476 RepID=A0A2P5DVE9_PARAD|nr:WRKY domain containing protein [Parasponia andersonii]